MKKFVKKMISILIAVCLLATMAPSLFVNRVSAKSDDYQDRYMYIAKIINRKNMQSWDTGFKNDACNAWPLFSLQEKNPGSYPGISGKAQDDYADGSGVNIVNGHFWGVIKVSDIPALKRLAEGGTARYMVKVGCLNSTGDHGAYIWTYTNKQWYGYNEEGGAGYANSPSKWYAHSTKDESDLYNSNSGWLKFDADDYIIIETETHGAGTAVENISLYFADIDNPVINDYTFTTNGTERDNTNINQKELFLKKGEYIDLKYNFREPVKASYAPLLNELSSHMLFTNPAGTGLPAAGQNQGLSLVGDASGDISSLSLKYTASDFHHTGNLPIDNGGELSTQSLNRDSLYKKIDEANFCDGAGNPLVLTGFNKASSLSKPYLAGKTINPFEYGTNKGYRVIIDAVPPKYTMVGNGIQPEILTGVTLNKGDEIEFTVQLTEDVIVKEGWSPERLFLHFNNGMKAYYVDGSNTKNWKFRMTVPEGETVNVPLLKCTALTHDLKGDSSDKNVIQDYAGNMLVDSANSSKTDNSDPSQTTPFTKIDWAKLSIDNTKPVISFRYDSLGANDTIYRKNGKITIDANDPAIKVPSLDPDEPDYERPSKGIYRPGNMTGTTDGSSPAVGLVYYTWSKSGENPFAQKDGDNFAAVKRFSLTALQPREDLYSGEFHDVDLMVANNKTNMIEPPKEAITSENSGIWYLHTWTSDMTWDSARELMQYEKMKNYKVNNPAVFQQWKDEYKAQNSGASDQDAELYAEKKTLEAVGTYSDMGLWTLSDFKKDDSNWVYEKAQIQLDNTKPVINIEAPSGNDSPVVTIQVTLEDEHSGLDGSKLKSQWVKAGEEPTDINWNDIPDNRVITTLNNVIEDGEYDLYVKACDKAGNENMQKLNAAVTVNSTVSVQTYYMPETNDSYIKSCNIFFGIDGINPDKVEYSFSLSSVRPQEDAYTDVTSSVYGSVYGNVYGKSLYTIPADFMKNGIYFAHLKVKEEDKDRYYYYYKQYKFDNIAPEITFSKNGVDYPKETHSVTITANDSLSGVAVRKYQWVKAGDPLPEEASAKWLELPDGNTVTIDNTDLSPGETVDYVLYSFAKDGAGNSITKNTGSFKVTKKSQSDTPDVSDSELLYIYGDAIDGYSAILKLGLESAVKEGYRYSLSMDDGASWSKWQPYSNFLEVKVPSNNAKDINIKFKYKTPGGKISDIVQLRTDSYSKVEPVYAIAAHSTLRPVGANSLSLDIKVPAGIRAVPSKANPTEPVRVKANVFRISQNGCYSFDLTDTADSSRTDTLLVVVDNIDTTAPQGSIEYSVTEKTNANVLVKLDASEPVRVINNEGRLSYTFTENGTFTFEFEDEAGNRSSVTASVNNIDRTPPKATIVKSYTYGKNGSKTFNTIKDTLGNVLLAQGVTLEVQKMESGDKDFKIVEGTNTNILQKNGTVEFSILDTIGNTSIISEEITNIVSYLPEPLKIIYEFVNDQGYSLPEESIVVIDGKKYAKGRVKVTISGKVEAPNRVFIGTVPSIDQSGNYLNLISDETGNFSYSKIYSANGNTRLAICDLLGNVNKVPIDVEGLDNEAPSITLNMPFAGITQNKEGFDPLADLGGFVLSDNISKPENVTVTTSSIDISKPGIQLITYMAKDEAGNTSTASQEVFIIPGDGMMVLGNGALISAGISEKVIFDTNIVTFNVSRYNIMDVEGESMINEWGKYDIFYQSGLYREGQMKYIAKGISLQELLDSNFTVEFPKVGWYTIIIRTQEREREYTTFFIGRMSKK